MPIRRSRKILVIGHDRGGLNQLLPLLIHWNNHPGINAIFMSTPGVEYEITSRGPGVRTFTWELNGRHPCLSEENILERAFKEDAWDLLLTGTSIGSALEQNAWLKARQMGITSMAICDMWTEYQRRITNGGHTIFPDIFLVLDERMASEARKILPSNVPIKVVGSPHFNFILQQSKTNKNRVGDRIRFISEPTATLFPKARIHEFLIAQMLVEVLDEVHKADRLLFRLHPRDDTEAWRRFAYLHREKGVALDYEPSWVSYSSTEMAIGISSMMLTELAIFGVPVASFHVPRSEESYYCLPEKDLGISVVRSRGELRAWLRNPIVPCVSKEFIEMHGSSITTTTDFVLEKHC